MTGSAACTSTHGPGTSDILKTRTTRSFAAYHEICGHLRTHKDVHDSTRPRFDVDLLVRWSIMGAIQGIRCDGQGNESMRVLSLLIICSLPLLQAGEHDRSPSSPRGPLNGIHAGVDVHPTCLDRHRDESCPCGLSDDSLCPSFEDDDTLEDLLLAGDALHSWASSDLDLNPLNGAAPGRVLPSRAARSRPLLC